MGNFVQHNNETESENCRTEKYVLDTYLCTHNMCFYFIFMSNFHHAFMFAIHLCDRIGVGIVRYACVRSLAHWYVAGVSAAFQLTIALGDGR